MRHKKKKKKLAERERAPPGLAICHDWWREVSQGFKQTKNGKDRVKRNEERCRDPVSIIATLSMSDARSCDRL